MQSRTTVRHLIALISFQRSSIADQLSSIAYRLSSIVYQLSPIVYQLSSIVYQLSSIANRQSASATTYDCAPPCRHLTPLSKCGDGERHLLRQC